MRPRPETGLRGRARDDPVADPAFAPTLRLGDPPPPPTARQRLRDSLPLLALGAAFLAGAAVASAGHIRLLSSPFPLWIVLSIDGIIAAVAGGTAVFLADPDRAIDDDPSIVRVPRYEWEALLIRLEKASRAPAREEAPWMETPAAAPAAPARPAPVRAEPAPPAVRTSHPQAMDPRVLQVEVALMELESLAESALVTRERLGNSEFDQFVIASSEEIRRLAGRLGRPPETGETPLSLLVRLLADASRRPDLPISAAYAADLRTQSHRLARSLRPTGTGPAPAEGPTAPSAAPTAARPLRSPSDEVDSLLRELEDREAAPAGKRPARRAPPAGPSDEEPDATN